MTWITLTAIYAFMTGWVWSPLANAWAASKNGFGELLLIILVAALWPISLVGGFIIHRRNHARGR